MKIILLRDVPKVGKKYEVKDIPDGYARNALIPKGLVKEATQSALAELERTKKNIIIEHEVQDTLLEKSLADLKKVTLLMEGKGNDEGHLFASIHAEDISKALEKRHFIVIDPEYIKLEKPIKTTGEHEVPISVKGKSVMFKIVVSRVK